MESRSDEGVVARNVVLVGFMGAGKSTVGQQLAAALGWTFIDLDEAIVRESGSSVAELFRTRGEAAFRALESRLTARLSSVEHAVIAPGGGWITDPANPARLPRQTRTVWLRVSAEEAVRRIQAAGVERPLLAATADPVAAARALLEQRETLYGTADVVVDVDGREPAEIVEEIRSTIRFEE